VEDTDRRVPIDAQKVDAPLSQSAVFLTVVIGPEPDDLATVREVVAGLDDLAKTVGFRDMGANVSCVVGIGATAWQRLGQAARPAELRPFTAITGGAHTAPSTPGDLLFHIRADRADLCFEFERLLLEQLGLAPAVGDRADAAADVPGRPARAPRPHPRRVDRRHGCDVLRAAAAPARGARRRGVKPGPRPKAPSARPSADSKGTPL
jgi:deferrochelatase/peroxidase EfeB